MSNEVKTTNIVLSNDYRLLVDLMNGSQTISTLAGSHALILDSNHHNFISLTHDFNFNNNNQGAKAPSISIELLDPENNFNEHFIFASLRKIKDGAALGDPLATRLSQANYAELLRIKELADKNGDFGYINAIYGNDIPIEFQVPTHLSDNVFESIDARSAGVDPSSLDFKNHISEEDSRTIQLIKNKNVELSSLINSQLQSVKSEISNPNIFIMYGIGSNLNTWAGPFSCMLTNIDYRFNGGTGAKSIILTFTPFGTLTMLTGENVFKNGLGILLDPAPSMEIFDSATPVTFAGLDVSFTNPTGPGVPSKEEAKANRLVGKLTYGLGLIQNQTVHSVVTTLITNYIKQGTVDCNILVLLPDTTLITKPYLDVTLNQARNFITSKSKDSSRIANTNFFVTAYAYTQLYRYLGFQIITDRITNNFIGNVTPEQFIESYGSFLGDKSYSSTKIALLKYPNQTYREPIDNLMNNLASNGYPIDFDIEVIHNIGYINELSSYLKRIGNKTKINPIQPLIIAGDRSLIEKFLFGKKSLEDAGVIKYVSLPDNNGKPTKNFTLDQLLSSEDQIFNTPEYTSIAKKYFLQDLPEYPYDFTTLPTDTYQFINRDESINIIKETGLTVFRLGTENANILDINSNLNLAYYAALQQIWFSETFVGRSHSGGIKVNVDDELSPHNVGLRDAKQDIFNVSILNPETIKQKVDQYKDQLASDLGINNQTLDEITASLINMLTYSKFNRNFSIPVDWASGDDAFTQLIRLLIAVNRSAVLSTIKTLPAFHLSNCTFGMPTVLMVLGEPGLIGKTNDYSILKTLGGFWRIIGFEHKISNYDISSSFHLAKDLSVGLPQLLTVPITKSAF